MKKILVVVTAVVLMFVLADAVSARTRVEKWLDLTGNYNYNGETGENWKADVEGHLNFIMGVKSRLDTRLNLIYGKDGDSYINDQKLEAGFDYNYNASRQTKYTLGIAGYTLKRKEVGAGTGIYTDYSEDITVKADALLDKYISRRWTWKAGIENWYYSIDKVYTLKVVTRLLYNVPFGRYLSKATLNQEIFLGREVFGGNLYTMASITRFSYELYKRITLEMEAQFVFDSPGRINDWSKREWDEKKIEIVYHLY